MRFVPQRLLRVCLSCFSQTMHNIKQEASPPRHSRSELQAAHVAHQVRIWHTGDNKENPLSTITFNTLEFTRKLREAGFDEKQAETVVRVIADAQGTLVTREHFDARMASTDARIEASELRLTIKLGTFLAVFAGIIIAALRVPL